MENLTAKVSCFARAYHCKNNPAHIFADTAAEALLGAEYAQIARSMAEGIGYFLPGFEGSTEEGLRLIVDKQLSPSVLGRSAYCEGMLKNERRLGCRQYVIFAAGYDTFALRDRDAELSVYELDLPDMIADKKARVERAGLKSRAAYVPCSLADPSWRERLTASGFASGLKSFGSLLGISYYLDKEAFKRLLMTLSGAMSAGSAICFDYPAVEGSRETRTNEALARGAGEAMKARYGLREMEALLAECGFLMYEHLTHQEMTAQYFADYNARCPEHRMEAPQGVCYVLAVRACS